MTRQKSGLIRRITCAKSCTRTLGLASFLSTPTRTNSRCLAPHLHRLGYWPVRLAPMVKKYFRLSHLEWVDMALWQRHRLPQVRSLLQLSVCLMTSLISRYSSICVCICMYIIWDRIVSVVVKDLPKNRSAPESTARRDYVWSKIILKLFQCFVSDVATDSGYMWNKTLKLFQNYFNDIEHVAEYSWAAISLWSNVEIVSGKIILDGRRRRLK